jgi:hypothetical protein
MVNTHSVCWLPVVGAGGDPMIALRSLILLLARPFTPSLNVTKNGRLWFVMGRIVREFNTQCGVNWSTARTRQRRR